MPSTFSIVAYDDNTGDLGIAVQSKFLAVGALVPWAVAGVGAIATQAHANVAYGPDGLSMLEEEVDVISVLEELLENDEGRDIRQVGIVDAEGNAAAFTGESCIDWAGHMTGTNYTCQGNVLVGEEVVEAMAAAFETTDDDLADRLLASLDAGQAAGGDKRGQQSSALVVVREGGGYAGISDRLVDLRVDDHRQPIEELRRLLELHKLHFGVTEPASLLKIDPPMARQLQDILQRLGYYDGPLTGNYDSATRLALESWHTVENLEDRLWQDAFIDPQVLTYMRKKLGD
ncbi:MAG: DUF1028 domain-containing protein [Candidatus Latescibacteria bacterium]|jgi:uncharacterized Ntn-hydrolase superfamily protein|nr:DUF1028 domain-containing protein [Candidatus Latescibacterota bacterium]